MNNLLQKLNYQAFEPEIKNEHVNKTDFNVNTLTGKILDYQFVVHPKQEPVEVKTELPSIDLVGEIIECSDEKCGSISVSSNEPNAGKTLVQKHSYYCKDCDDTFPIKKHKVHLELVKIRNKSVTDSNPYFCIECDIVFNNSQNAVNHLYIHDREEFHCKLCTYTSKVLLDLKYHIKTIHSDVDTNADLNKIYHCADCNYKTNYYRDLSKHRDIKHINSKLKFKCEECNEYWPDKDHNLHEKFKHITRNQITKENPFVCKTCNLEFTDDDYIYEHLKDHGDIGHFCNLCSFNSDDQSKLEEHKQLQHPNQIKLNQDEQKEILNSNLSCQKCNLLWPDRNHETHLKMLEIMKKGVSEKSPYPCCACNKAIIDIKKVYYHLSLDCSKLKCDKCPFKAFLTTAMESHKRNMHSKVEEYKFYCDLCDYKGKHLRHLRQHQVRHKSEHEKVYYHCDKCLFKTTHRWYLSTHVAKAHEKYYLKELSCPDCTFTTPYAQNLVAHKRNNHNNEVYSCSDCAYQTSNRRQFKNHEHKKYICDFCASIFTDKRRFDNHLEKTHNIKPVETKFICYTCNYESCLRSEFIKHVRKHRKPVHTEKMYCANCDYSTVNKKHLIQHMLVHADPLRMKMHKCLICSFTTKRLRTLRYHIKTHASVSEDDDSS